MRYLLFITVLLFSSAAFADEQDLERQVRVQQQDIEVLHKEMGTMQGALEELHAEIENRRYSAPVVPAMESAQHMYDRIGNENRDNANEQDIEALRDRMMDGEQ